MKQSANESQNWQTPEWLLERVREVFDGPIGVDPCTTEANPTAAKHFYTPENDGLAQGWDFVGPIFMNPPYGRQIWEWTYRFRLCREERIALLPARTDTKWWHRDIVPIADAICFVRSRIRFVDPDTGEIAGAGMFPSAVVYAGPSIGRFRNSFLPHGWVV